MTDVMRKQKQKTRRCGRVGWWCSVRLRLPLFKVGGKRGVDPCQVRLKVFEFAHEVQHATRIKGGGAVEAL